MKNYIKQTLADYLKRNGVDGYGQMRVLTPSEVFKERTAEVLEYNKTENLLPIMTYGSRYGTYEGFNPSYINDEEIKNACHDARKQNPTYIHAMTSW